MNEQRVSQSPDSPVAPSSGLNPVLLGHTQGALVSRDQVLITLSPPACTESLMAPSRLNLLRTITDFCHLHSSSPCPGPGSLGPHPPRVSVSCSRDHPPGAHHCGGGAGWQGHLQPRAGPPDQPLRTVSPTSPLGLPIGCAASSLPSLSPPASVPFLSSLPDQ